MHIEIHVNQFPGEILTLSWCEQDKEILYHVQTHTPISCTVLWPIPCSYMASSCICAMPTFNWMMSKTTSSVWGRYEYSATTLRVWIHPNGQISWTNHIKTINRVNYFAVWWIWFNHFFSAGKLLLSKIVIRCSWTNTRKCLDIS